MSCRPAPRGMTLLEVLLVLALMTTIFSLVWQLVSLYSRHYELGEKRMNRAQLTRSISQVLSDDLSSAVQDPIHPARTGLTEMTALRRFGLRGDTTSLAIDVVEPNLLSRTATLEENQSFASTGGKPTKPQVPELKTIYYEFVPISARAKTVQTKTSLQNNEQGNSPFVQRFGLLRKELDFETPEPEDESLANTGNTTGASSSMQTDGSEVIGSLAAPPTSAFFTDTPPLPTEIQGSNIPVNLNATNPLSGGNTLSTENNTISNLPRERTAAQIALESDDGGTWIPEVANCRFRYYDGQYWYDSWDSLLRSGLPVAIEVSLELMTLDDVENLRSSPYRGYSLDTAIRKLDLSPLMSRTLVINLPITPLARHTTVQRRRPVSVKEGKVQTGSDSTPAAARTAGTSERTAQERLAAVRSIMSDADDGLPGRGLPPPNERSDLGTPGMIPLPVLQEVNPFAGIEGVADGFSPNAYGSAGFTAAPPPSGSTVLPLTSQQSADTSSGSQKNSQTWIRNPKKQQ